MNLTHEDVRNILKIVDGSEHLEELELEFGGVRLHVRRHGGDAATPSRSNALASTSVPLDDAAQRTRQPQVASDDAQSARRAVPEGLVAIRAPMLGTFYRSPSPGEPPFVNVGQTVAADNTVCLIEVMKLFNSIKAGIDGTVVRIDVENASLVEYDEVLVLIAPTKP